MVLITTPELPKPLQISYPVFKALFPIASNEEADRIVTLSPKQMTLEYPAEDDEQTQYKTTVVHFRNRQINKELHATLLRILTEPIDIEAKQMQLDLLVEAVDKNTGEENA